MTSTPNILPNPPPPHVVMVTNYLWECQAKNMIKTGKFSKIFFESSRMMLKLGMNLRWVDIL